MADAAGDNPLESIEARFLTWHDSAGNLHLRTNGPVLFIDKKKTELVAQGRALVRDQALNATGRTIYSKTLSTYVFEVESLQV